MIFAVVGVNQYQVLVLVYSYHTEVLNIKRNRRPFSRARGQGERLNVFTKYYRKSGVCEAGLFLVPHSRHGGGGGVWLGRVLTRNYVHWVGSCGKVETWDVDVETFLLHTWYYTC